MIAVTCFAQNNWLIHPVGGEVFRDAIQIEVNTSIYTFNGARYELINDGVTVYKSQITHTVNGVTSTVKRRFTYDHSNRLLNTYHEIDSNGEQLISENVYNELGDVITTKLHDGEQEVNYAFNVRGWLTSINDSQLSDPNDLFGMELNYNVNPIDGTNTHFNGNISSMQWSDRIEAGSGNHRSYNYTYDGLNRLTDADHLTNGVNSNSYDVQNLQYDLNGNILSLDRRGESTSGFMDDLSYSYNGNQLQQVDDSGDDSAGFTESSSGIDYAYDDNGDMISDANKGITSVEYDHLNLPTKVTFDAQNYIAYLYDAAGVKLQQKVYKDGALEKTTDYVSSFIYEDGTLQFVQNEHGRVVPKNGGWDYQYHLKDHLGNVRLTFSTTHEFYEMKEDFEGGETNGWEDVHRHTNANANTTIGGDEVERLQSGQTGAMIFLSLNKGDTVDLSVNANYESAPNEQYISWNRL